MTNKDNKKDKKEPGTPIDLGFGNLFKGIGNLFDLVSEVTEKGEEFREKVQEFQGKGPLKDINGVYGFSIRTGIGGKPKVESFGNVKSTPQGPVVEETREPIVDVLEEEDKIQVVVEMPGVEEHDIQIEINGDVLSLSADSSARKYQKEILLPSKIQPEPISHSYQNGIFEIWLKK